MSPLIIPFHRTTHRNTHFHIECTPKICVPFNQIFNARPAKRSEIFLLLKLYFSKSRLNIPGNSIILSSKNLDAYFWCMCESFQSQLNAVTCAFEFKNSKFWMRMQVEIQSEEPINMCVFNVYVWVWVTTRHAKKRKTDEIIESHRIHDHTFFSLACHSQKPLRRNWLLIEHRRCFQFVCRQILWFVSIKEPYL